MKIFKNKIYNSGFTLVEIIVAVTIFSIIVVSMMSIFINSSQLSLKIDINRNLQENSKNIIETITEDIRYGNFNDCGTSSSSEVCISDTKFSSGSEIKIGGNHYYLAIKNKQLNDFIKISDISDCEDKHCFLMRNGQILSNSNVRIKSLFFNLYSDFTNKLQINMKMAPSFSKGVKRNLIENSELNLQTTLNDNFLYK